MQLPRQYRGAALALEGVGGTIGQSAAAPASNAVEDSSVLADLLLRITDKRSLELGRGLDQAHQESVQEVR